MLWPVRCRKCAAWPWTRTCSRATSSTSAPRVLLPRVTPSFRQATAALELLDHELLHGVLGERAPLAHGAGHFVEGRLQDFLEAARRAPVRGQALLRPAGLEELHQVGAADHLHAGGGAHQLDRPG